MGGFSGLLNNSMLLLALCVVYDSFGIYTISNKKIRDGITGILISIITVAVMVNPWVLKPGVFFDSRSVILGLSGLFFGIIPTSIAATIGVLLRIYQGGAGTLPGSLVVISTASFGLFWRYWTEKNNIELNWKQLYVFGFFLHLVFVSCLVTLPASIRSQVIMVVAPPLISIFPFITLLGGIILLKQEVRRKTEKKLVEHRQLLAKERGLLRGVIDTIPDLIHFKDIEGRYLGCNKAFQEYFEKEEKEIIGKFPKEVFDEDFAAYAVAKDIETMTNETITNYEASFQTRNGKSAIFETIKTPFKGTDGTLYGLVGISRNIDERKQAEKTLKISEEKYRLAMEATTDGLWDWDIGSNEVYYNPSWLKIVGETDVKPAYESWLERVHPKEKTSVILSLQDHLEGKSQYWEKEHRLKTKSGEWKYVLGRGRVVETSENGEPLRMVGTMTDLTTRKILESHLKQAQKMESVGRLAGGVAHDFNNMLSVILGNTEMVLEQLDKDLPFYDNMMEIQKAARRSADITRQLLAFARKQTIAPKILDLNTAVNDMLKMLQRLIGEDIELIWLPGEKLWPVKMDPSQIDQILANLSVNARDAISDVGKITIETGNATFDEAYCKEYSGFSPGDFVQLVVSDNGCGMEKEALDNLFEPFYTTKAVNKGTGLGLATVYGIVKQNHGFINVYSEPNKGTSFKIYLPRHETDVKHILRKGTVTPGSKRRETILLVEDEQAILTMTATMLERLNYKVLTAIKPGNAIRIANEYNADIHLLMTDVIMPEMNGKELAQNLRKIFPNLKCLFMSGYTADVIAHHGVLDEHVNFIHKPFSKRDLSIKLRKILDEDANEIEHCASPA